MMKVKWIPHNKETALTVPPPTPASQYIPDWYSKSKSFGDDNVPVFENGEVANMNVKMCSPFLDAMTAGYIQETWCDLLIDSADGETITQTQTARTPTLVGFRKAPAVPIPPYVYATEMIWYQPWQPVLPKGYSMLYLPPVNRIDSPIITLSGMVDHDVFHHSIRGNYPFYIRKGFKGIIPAGTPMFQMIPIKRDQWKSEALPHDDELITKQYSFMHNHFMGVYRRYFHQKKKYT